MKATLLSLTAAMTLTVAAYAQAPDVLGKWGVNFHTPQGTMPATLVLAKEGDRITGTMVSHQGEVPVEATLKDKAISISLSIQSNNGAMNIIMSGTVDGESMAGDVDFGGRGNGTWDAKRTEPGAKAAQSPDAPQATMTGAWQFEVTHSAGTSTPTVTITQTGEKLSGKYAGSYGESELTGSIKGKEFTFTVEIGTEQKVRAVYTGTFEANAVKGSVTLGELGEGTFTGKRK